MQQKKSSGWVPVLGVLGVALLFLYSMTVFSSTIVVSIFVIDFLSGGLGNPLAPVWGILSLTFLITAFYIKAGKD